MNGIILNEAVEKKASPKKYKCPYCDLRFERNKLHIHIQKEHEDMIPEGYTALRVAFNTINKKDKGSCIICSNETRWNEDKGRYERLCDDPKCKEEYKRIVAERNKKKYGTERLQTDPRYREEVQRKALEGRKNSGVYKFSDGGEVKFFGTYEKKFLEFMDKVMNCKSEDIMSPGPAIEYIFEGKSRLYLPDFYYIPYNLLIEIKDGGSNPNNHPHRTGSDALLIKAKEDAIKKKGEYSYLRLTDNNFAQLMSIMAALKFQLLDNVTDPIYRINEETLLENLILSRKDVYYNKAKFDSGEINLCFITGHSGSGKSTMGRYMSTDKIEHYELDDLLFVEDHFTMENLKEYGDLIYSFFKGPGKKFYHTMKYFEENKISESEYEDKLFVEFVKYSKSYAKSHKNRKYIVEGIWLLEEKWFKPSDFKDDAFYIKGTSAVKSLYRATKRDGLNRATMKKAMLYKNRDKALNKYIKYFEDLEKKQLNETGMSGTIGAAIVGFPSPAPHETVKDNYYVVQHMQNNTFDYSITKDPLQYKMYSVDPSDKNFYKVFKTNKGDINKSYLTFKVKDKQKAKELYDELAHIAENGGKIYKQKDEIDAVSYIYSMLTEGSQIITNDQILFDSRFELVKDFEAQLEADCQRVYDYLHPGSLDLLEEQLDNVSKYVEELPVKNQSVPDASEDDMLTVMPDGVSNTDDLEKWKAKYDGMTHYQRKMSNNASIEKYGQNNLERYNQKLGELSDKDREPKHIEIRESSSDFKSINIDTADWRYKLERVRIAERDGLIIMVDTDSDISNYTEDILYNLKMKWERLQGLNAEKRALSNQTASAIFGVDNFVLYDRILNFYSGNHKKEKVDYRSLHLISQFSAPTDSDFLSTNAKLRLYDENTKEGIDYCETLEELTLKLRNTSDPIKREAIKEVIINLGWNPEIPFTREAASRTWMRQINWNIIEEIEVDENYIQEAQKSTEKVSKKLTSEYLKDKIVPVFVCLTRGIAPHSKAIQWFTDSEWSHASMCFDSSLKEMYTFTVEGLKQGFGIDTIERYLKQDPNMKIKLFALFVTPEQRDEMKKAVDWYIENQDKTRYNFKGILDILMRKVSGRDKYKMICSQFVYSILSIVKLKMRKTKDQTQVTPADLDQLTDDARFYVVYQSTLKDYNKRKVDKLCYDLLPTLPMELYGIEESSGSTMSVKVKSAIGPRTIDQNNILEMASMIIK